MIGMVPVEALTIALVPTAAGVWWSWTARAARAHGDVAVLVLESARMERVDGHEARAILTLRNVGAALARDVRLDHRPGAGPCPYRMAPSATTIPHGDTVVVTMRVDLERLHLSVTVGDCHSSVERWCAGAAELDVHYIDRRGARQYVTLRLPERGTLGRTPAPPAAIAG